MYGLSAEDLPYEMFTTWAKERVEVNITIKSVLCVMEEKYYFTKKIGILYAVVRLFRAYLKVIWI